MEPTATPGDEPARADPARSDWRSLSTLRDRVEAAAREIERLRAENVALGKQLVDLQDGAPGPSFSFGSDESPQALKARVQGFIDLVDGLLAAEPPSASATPEPATSEGQRS